MSARLVLLDRVLANYGPEAKGARDLLRDLVVRSLDRSLQAQATSTAMALGETRWLMYAQAGNSISKLMLAILVFWLTMIFISFGLSAPANATVTSALLVCGLSVSGAIFLILELYAPYGGLITVSSAPLRDALAQLGQ